MILTNQPFIRVVNSVTHIYHIMKVADFQIIKQHKKNPLALCLTLITLFVLLVLFSKINLWITKIPPSFFPLKKQQHIFVSEEGTNLVGFYPNGILDL